MTTYIYETLPANSTEEPLYYEVVQPDDEEPLTAHPETGVPLRRVMVDGKPLVRNASDSCGCGTEGCC